MASPSFDTWRWTGKDLANAPLFQPVNDIARRFLRIFLPHGTSQPWQGYPSAQAMANEFQTMSTSASCQWL